MSDLTKEERNWLKRIEKLLSNPPSNRIGFYTIGDASLSVYDRTKETSINTMMDNNSSSDFGQCVDAVEADLGFINSACPIHSVSG